MTIMPGFVLLGAAIFLLVALLVGVAFEARRSRQIRKQREGDYQVYKTIKGEKR